MITRFSRRARAVLKRANDEAARRGDGAVGGEHVLAGLLLEPGALASRMLRRQGVEVGPFWDAVDEPAAPRPSGPLPPSAPLTAGAARALKRAGEAAEALSRREIGAEFLLLGLLRDRDGGAARALVRLGIDVDALRVEVAGILEARD
jgi:ATP-dependent Clp protease ATP-binding subunit ClpC